MIEPWWYLFIEFTPRLSATFDTFSVKHEPSRGTQVRQIRGVRHMGRAD
jgi:hypothetical protein